MLMLSTRLSDLKEDGIYVTPAKTEGSTGKSLIYEWNEDLRSAVEMAKASRPRISNFLFCNRLGNGYVNEETGRAGGWDSMWSNFVERVLDETEIEARFTEHDLRAKCASDAGTLEHAQQLLSHADKRTTQRIYRRKAERVKPLERKFE
jgi:integrase